MKWSMVLMKPILIETICTRTAEDPPWYAAQMFTPMSATDQAKLVANAPITLDLIMQDILQLFIQRIAGD